MRRVVVIGTTGSGKSRLAERLAARTGLRVIELDALFWGRDWQGALEAIERGRKTDEANALKLLYNLYEARIRDYQKNPPPEDWNGAFALLTK